MTAIERQKNSLVGREEDDLEAAIELAAARAEVNAARLLRTAFERSPATQKDLARRLELSEGRVSQVLHSDGNVRTTTLARFLRALGYKLQLGATPLGADVASLEPRRVPRRKSAPRVYSVGSELLTETVVVSRRGDLDRDGPKKLTYVGSLVLSQGSAEGAFRNPMASGGIREISIQEAVSK